MSSKPLPATHAPPLPSIKYGARCFDCIPIPGPLRPLRFFLGLFACRGTVMRRALPMMATAILWGWVAKIWWTKYPFEIPNNFWSPLYTVTIFLGVFRTNQAFQDYKEGPKLLGKIVNSLTAAVRLAAALHAQSLDFNPDVKRIAQLANTMANLVRIDLEPLKIPGQKPRKKHAPVANPSCTKWAYHDIHADPPLHELLNEEEVDMYSKLNAHDRVMLASSLLVEEFAKGAPLPHTVRWFAAHVEDASAAWKGCCRIRDNDVPFSFGHLYHLMLFVTFVFGTPIAIMCNERTEMWGLGLCAFAPFLVYALEIMADEMDNPFGWDTNDHDLTKFCTALHRSTMLIVSVRLGKPLAGSGSSSSSSSTSSSSLNKTSLNKTVRVMPSGGEGEKEKDAKEKDAWNTFGNLSPKSGEEGDTKLIKI
jgi:predicted membrane chloride channel (bestrophin family)